MSPNPNVRISFVRVDTGFCRIYYRVGTHTLICFQEDFPQKFQAYVCTRDGEPSHRYDVSYLQMHLLPKPPTSVMDMTLVKSFWSLVSNFRGPVADPLPA